MFKLRNIPTVEMFKTLSASTFWGVRGFSTTSRLNNTLNRTTATLIELMRGDQSKVTAEVPEKQFSFNVGRTISDIKRQAESIRMNETKGAILKVDIRSADQVERAINKLRTLIRTNNISHEAREQQYHVRNGVKRRETRSRNHRAGFKQGFLTMLNKVKDAKRKGY